MTVSTYQTNQPAYCWGNTLQGEPAPFQKQGTRKVSGTKEFQDLCLNLIATIAADNTMVVAYLKGGGGESVGPSLCPAMENPDLVLQETGSSPTHSRFNHVPSGIHYIEIQCLVIILNLSKKGLNKSSLSCSPATGWLHSVPHRKLL